MEYAMKKLSLISEVHFNTNDSWNSVQKWYY
jgi:hypothetical protein